MAASRSRRILLLASILAIALPVSAAHADGPRTPFVVARGHSLFGAPWQIRFGEERGYGDEPPQAIFLFSVGTAAERHHNESGYYSSVPLPLRPGFTFDPTSGSDFDRFEESDMSGAAGPHVKRVELKMPDGSALEAELLRAPAGQVESHPALRPFRFFDLFFPDSAEPVSVAAYGPHGKLVQRYSLAKRAGRPGRAQALWPSAGAVGETR